MYGPEIALFVAKNAIFDPGGSPDAPRVTGSPQKNLAFLCPIMMATKILDDVTKNGFGGQKTALKLSLGPDLGYPPPDPPFKTTVDPGY